MTTPSVNQIQIHPFTLSSTKQNPSIEYITKGLYEAHRYFSPFQYRTQDELIKDIHSLGDQINSIEEIDIEVRRQQQFELQRQEQIINQVIMLTQSVDKHKHKHAYESINKIKTIISNQHKTQPQLNKKLHQRDIIKSYTNQRTQRPMHKQLLYERTLSKENQYKQQQYHNKHSKEVASKLTEKNRQNYSNFIQKNINKLVKKLNQEKQALQPTNTNISKPVNTNITQQKNKNIIKTTTAKNYNKQPKNKHNQTTNFNQSFVDELSRENSKQKMNQTISSALFQNSRVMLQRKEEKIQKYREQKIQKEAKQTTFQPQSFTSKYRSKNELIDQNKNLRNFIKRQQIDNEARRKNHFKQLEEAMQECSFQPRLNLKSKQSLSIVKEIWRPNSSLERNHVNNNKIVQNRSIQKFNNHQFTSHHYLSSQETRRSIGNSLLNSKRSTLFNQSTQISLQDAKELSFLFK